ncbi:MAG: hypothetical protein IKS77_07855 [Spirochaetales bacterium]|nr:hypothetical protein [Spirochaetales bacterium]
MTGIQRRMAKLLKNDGKLFLAAFDHPQIYGTMEGLENTPDLVKDLKNTELDGFILNPGMFARICPKSVDDKVLVLRGSVGGTMMGTVYSDVHYGIASAELAAQLDADAVLVMFVIGGSKDMESEIELARVCEEYHKLGIPVIAEVLAADYTKNNDSSLVSSGARIAAELGADMIKAFYCPDFDKVTSNCPVPVILAGGPKDADIVSVVKEVVSKGAVGLAFGRNIFQSKDIRKTIKELNGALRK